MTNKQRILRMVQRWPDHISYDEAVYHMFALMKIDDGLKSLDLETRVKRTVDKLQRFYDEKAAESVIAMSRLKEPKNSSAGKSKKPLRQKSDEPVFCRSCNQYYPQSSLIRRVDSFPGIKRKGGGPNGARREVWKCCPEDHRLTRVSLRVS